MALDVTTLNLAGRSISFFSGIFLLVVWWQDRHRWSALWGSIGNAMLGAGIILAGLHAGRRGSANRGNGQHRNRGDRVSPRHHPGHPGAGRRRPLPCQE